MNNIFNVNSLAVFIDVLYYYAMDKKINLIAHELQVSLKKSTRDFKGLYVFGSQVKKTATSNSDIDIVVILKNTDRKHRGIVWNIASKIEYDYGVMLDVHPMTQEELERNFVFYDEVVNNGVFYAVA